MTFVLFSAEEVYFDSLEFQKETKDWAKELGLKAWEAKEETDEIIKSYSKEWDFDRINAIDKNILRIALYELLHTELSPNIVINEALEVAKKYSTDDSPSFINGILGKVVKDKCLQDSSKS